MSGVTLRSGEVYREVNGVRAAEGGIKALLRAQRDGKLESVLRDRTMEIAAYLNIFTDLRKAYLK